MSSFYRKALSKAEESPEKLLSIARSMLNRCRYFETVSDSLSTGLIVFNSEHEVTEFNRQARRFFPGLKRGVKNGIGLFRYPGLVSFLEETLADDLRYQTREFRIPRKDRSPLVLEVLCDPWVEEGKIRGMIVQVRDITERESEHKKNDVCERLNSLLSMTASVAHEVKNPLAAMSLYIDILKKRLDRLSQKDEKLTECTDVLSEEIERLNSIVSGFLMTLRPLNLPDEPVSLSSLTDDVARLVRYDLESKHIELIVQKEEDVPSVIADVCKVKQVLLNLINNSINAMPDGGRLTLSLFRNGDSVALSVTDTGKGIPERLLPRIFDPYFTTSSSGTGLGLTIVYQIMKSHGGDIFIDSKEGEGTVFTLLFPVPQKEISLLSGD